MSGWFFPSGRLTFSIWETFDEMIVKDVDFQTLFKIPHCIQINVLIFIFLYLPFTFENFSHH